jgi:ABC-type phosphate/phosphonate transport system substrate-binding protein
VSALATLPMYDLPELLEDTDAFWRAIAARLRGHGRTDVPERLSRDASPEAGWRDSRLVLSQTCGYPLTHGLGAHLRVVATPSYAAAGCEDATHRSAVMVRADVGHVPASALRGTRAAVNAFDSHSGMNALRAFVAPHARDGRFFSEVVETGSHRASISALRDGRADAAAIDAVTLALIEEVSPRELSGLEILAWTDPTPCLPFVTRRDASDEMLFDLQSALDDVVRDPALRDVCARLRISHVTPSRVEDYEAIMEMERFAARCGYPMLD